MGSVVRAPVGRVVGPAVSAKHHASNRVMARALDGVSENAYVPAGLAFPLVVD